MQELIEAESWLDDWEKYILELPTCEHTHFLSKQTLHGLRVTLRSCRELAAKLLHDGFSYVMTGKFNQDPLEVILLLIL